EHHGLSQTGEGFSAQKQVGLRTDYENGDSEEVVDISEIGNISENGTNNRNANNNVTVETQVEDERRVRKDKRGRDDVQTNNVKVPEGLSDSSRARMKHVVRSSNKRSIHTVGPETPTKKPRGTGSTSTTQLQSAASATTGSPTDQSYWEEWDMKREPHTSHAAHTTGTIKAIRLWDRFCRRPGLSFANSAYPQGVSPHRVNILVTMVLAVGNSHGFGALKRAMVAVQQGGAPSTADVFSNEPQRLVRTLTAIDTAGEMYGYMRRFALARLAKLYRSTTANAGRLVTNDEDAWISRRRPPTKVDKAKAYCSMIEHIWDTAFPDHYKGQAMTKSGLIDSNAPDAARWNQCKRKLSKQIEAGQRWLSWAERFGWSSLGLVTRDWSIGDVKVVVSDRIFEETLTAPEHVALLNAVDTEKGRFLRQLDRALGGSLFELLQDPSRAETLPLLKLDDEEIMTRPDCDPRWVVELTSQESTPE
ncbi:uncharacterized protein PV06_11830, partial [Exophiala oligosperma]